MDLRHEKRALRESARARRRSIAAADAAVAALGVQSRFFAAGLDEGLSVIAVYWPLAEELDPRPLMTALHAAGHALALPIILGPHQPLAFRGWQPGAALVAAGFGTHEPLADAALVTPDLLLVPLLAFDLEGFRVGYGGGYYDRTLAGLRSEPRRPGRVVAVGVGFAVQEVDHVPHGPGDQRLDWIVTEREARRLQ